MISNAGLIHTAAVVDSTARITPLFERVTAETLKPNIPNAHYAMVQIVNPPELNDREKELFQEMRGQSTFNPRERPGGGPHGTGG